MCKEDGILILNVKHKVGQRPEGTIVVGTDPRGNLNKQSRSSTQYTIEQMVKSGKANLKTYEYSKECYANSSCLTNNQNFLRPYGGGVRLY